MFTYQLSDGIFDLELTKSMLSKGPSMNDVKYLPRASPTPRGTSLAFIGERDICMFPYFAFDIPNHSGDKERLDLIYTFPLLSSFPESTHSYETGGIVLLDNPGVTDTPHICLLHSAVKAATGCHEILLQVYRCNLRECKKMLKERWQKIIAGEEPNWKKRKGFVFPGTTKVKSIKFPVDVEQFRTSYLCSFTYVPLEFANPRMMTRSKSKTMRIQF
ncbi:hypothetical protein ACS0TY_008224 [Phlomoides rotata]